MTMTRDRLLGILINEIDNEPSTRKKAIEEVVAEYDRQAAEIARLTALNAQLLEALKKAKKFFTKDDEFYYKLEAAIRAAEED